MSVSFCITWRPEIWKNPYSKEADPLHMSNQEPNYTDYEDGADAMLEAITVALFEKKIKIKRTKGCLEILEIE